MVATKQDRTRAWRIRDAAKNGKNVSPEDAAWLAEYEATRSKRGRKPMSSAQPAPAPAQETPPPAEPTREPSEQSEPAPQPEMRVIDFGAPPEQPAALPVGPVCTIKDCPACKLQKGGATCAITGKKVWPPLSEAGARMLANTLLTVIGLAVSFFRKDKHRVQPTKEEREMLAKAIREFTYRRASWVGAVDDILGLVFVVGGYSMRAMKEKKPEGEKNDD